MGTIDGRSNGVGGSGRRTYAVSVERPAHGDERAAEERKPL